MRGQRIVRHADPSGTEARRWRRDPDPERDLARRRHHGEGPCRNDPPHPAPRGGWVEHAGRTRRAVLDRRRLPEPRPQASITASLEHEPARIPHDQGLPMHGRPRGLRSDGWNAIDRGITPGDASRSPRARLAMGRPRRARERTELHQPLVQGRRRRRLLDELLSRRPEPILRGTRRRVHGATVHAKQHARHVAIDDGCTFTMHDARDRTRGVPTDPRQGDELGRTHGDLAAEPRHAVLGRLVQPARAPVVATPLPHREHRARALGHRATKASNRSITRLTCVCCSMHSLTRAR